MTQDIGGGFPDDPAERRLNVCRKPVRRSGDGALDTGRLQHALGSAQFRGEVHSPVSPHHVTYLPVRFVCHALHLGHLVHCLRPPPPGQLHRQLALQRDHGEIAPHHIVQIPAEPQALLRDGQPRLHVLGLVQLPHHAQMPGRAAGGDGVPRGSAHHAGNAGTDELPVTAEQQDRSAHRDQGAQLHQGRHPLPNNQAVRHRERHHSGTQHHRRVGEVPQPDGRGEHQNSHQTHHHQARPEGHQPPGERGLAQILGQTTGGQRGAVHPLCDREQAGRGDQRGGRPGVTDRARHAEHHLQGDGQPQQGVYRRACVEVGLCEPPRFRHPRSHRITHSLSPNVPGCRSRTGRSLPCPARSNSTPGQPPAPGPRQAPP